MSGKGTMASVDERLGRIEERLDGVRGDLTEIKNKLTTMNGRTRNHAEAIEVLKSQATSPNPERSAQCSTTQKLNDHLTLHEKEERRLYTNIGIIVTVIQLGLSAITIYFSTH